MTEADRDRKALEAKFHDHIRGDLRDDRNATSNYKFYSVAKRNWDCLEDFVRPYCARGARVLDYCCGDGNFTRRLSSLGADAVGIDISPVSIERARSVAKAEGSPAQFEVMDAEATTFRSASFDLVTINGVLHHLDLDRAYREIARLLGPDGKAVATEALRHNPVFHLYRRLTPKLRTAWEAEHILGRREIFKARDYFETVRVLGFFHLAVLLAVPLRNTRVFEPVRRSLELVDRALLRVPGLRWYAWMAVFALERPKGVI
jgi:SAM-dependent methyltransferase